MNTKLCNICKTKKATRLLDTLCVDCVKIAAENLKKPWAWTEQDKAAIIDNRANKQSSK